MVAGALVLGEATNAVSHTGDVHRRGQRDDRGCVRLESLEIGPCSGGGLLRSVPMTVNASKGSSTGRHLGPGEPKHIFGQLRLETAEGLLSMK